jgi:hypothetical protein
MNNTTVDKRVGGSVSDGRSDDGVGRRALATESHGGDESVVIALVEAAKRAGIYPEDPDVLVNDVLNPDGLEMLFEERASGESRIGGHVVFELYGHTFVVTPEQVAVLE